MRLRPSGIRGTGYSGGGAWQQSQLKTKVRKRRVYENKYRALPVSGDAADHRRRRKRMPSKFGMTILRYLDIDLHK